MMIKNESNQIGINIAKPPDVSVAHPPTMPKHVQMVREGDGGHVQHFQAQPEERELAAQSVAVVPAIAEQSIQAIQQRELVMSVTNWMGKHCATCKDAEPAC